MSNKNNFCIRPFVGIELSGAGNFGPCCDYRPVIKDTPFPQYSLTNLMNNPRMKETRQNMLDNRIDPRCQVCYNNEAAGIKSQRQSNNELFNNQLQTFDSADQWKLQYLDLKLGNTCNQMCVICDYASSSMLREEDSTIWPKNKIKKITQWYRDPSAWQSIYDVSSDLKRIDFYGGEPFIIKEVWAYIKWLVDNNIANNIEVNFATNGSVFEESKFELLSDFKKVNLLVSADGTRETFEYARYPANWENVSKNIRAMHKLMRPEDYFAIAYTYSMYTVFNIVDSLEIYYNEFDNLATWFNPVNQDFYSINTLPNNVKSELQDYFTAKYNSKYLLAGVENFNFLHETLLRPREESAWEEFIRITKIRDRMRQRDITAIAPRLKDYFQ